MDVHGRLAERIRALRGERGFSLETLAARSGVSRSNISLVERGESSPTAVVLDKLAAALGVSLAALFEAEPRAKAAAEPSPVARAAEQASWQDPASGYVRRHLSPATGGPLQLVEVTFPAGARVAYDSPPRDADLHQQVWMLAGTMEITVGKRRFCLAAGDTLASRVDEPAVFRNPTRKAARYLVAVATLPRSQIRRR